MRAFTAPFVVRGRAPLPLTSVDRLLADRLLVLGLLLIGVFGLTGALYWSAVRSGDLGG